MSPVGMNPRGGGASGARKELSSIQRVQSQNELLNFS